MMDEKFTPDVSGKEEDGDGKVNLQQHFCQNWWALTLRKYLM
jgi:hypothetical protein